ncbi:MAG: aminotransferase class V-fold PLP-dependent enzyme [Limnochordia bacterium]|jgi:cysteine desulfurase family protein
METIYLDNSATSFPKPPEVYEAIAYATKYGVNADRGGYSLARQTGEMIQRTRDSIAELAGIADPCNVVLTPSATIALNIVLFGLQWSYGDNVYVSPFEHNSVLRPLYRLRDVCKVSLRTMPVERGNLSYDVDELEKQFKRVRPKLVVVNHGSNVCGVVAPLREIARLAKEYGALMLVDAAQTLGTIPVNMFEQDIDYLVFAGHKELYGPIGVGGLVVNTSIKLEPLIFGGTGVMSELEGMPDEYPFRLEAGSQNAAAIAGLAAGIRFVKGNPDIKGEKLRLFDLLLDQFRRYPEVKVFASPDKDNRLPIVSCTVSGYTPQEFAMVLDRHFGIAVRAGLHCSPKAHEFLGTAPLGAVRFSIGALNTEQDILRVGEALDALFS